MKIQYLEDTKRFADFTDYHDVGREALKAFNLEKSFTIGNNIKFYYIDHDGDIISITNEGDLQEA